MCFHFSQIYAAKALSQRFNVALDEDYTYPTGRFNAFNFPEIPIISKQEPQVLSTGTWGLIPPHIRDIEYRKYTLNARIESLFQKPSFKDVTQNRCLIPASAFYEWQWQDSKGKTKVPFEIQYQGQEIFAFAGLYSPFYHPILNITIVTFTIVTTAANELMSEVHNQKKRMPLILLPRQESLWLSDIPISEFAECNPPLVATPLYS
jgi:putative SOS response-associated peptidase YedK